MAADGANGTSGVAATAPGPITRDILITRGIIMAAPMAPLDITAASVVVVAVSEVAVLYGGEHRNQHQRPLCADSARPRP